jgi:hypothetical protein
VPVDAVARIRLRVLALAFACAAPLSLGACSSAEQEIDTSDMSELRKKYPKPVDLAKARAKCLVSKGWSATVSADGSLESNFPSSQGDDFDRDDIACQREVGIDPEAPTPQEVVKRDYKLYVEAARCLRNHGWPIGDPPTLQTFLDTYETDPWMPWDSVPGTDADRAEVACPFPEPSY